MQTVSLSDALGVELADFDIKHPCRAEEQATLRRLFCEHHLLLVRGQQVTAEDQRRFVSFFGPVRERGDAQRGGFRHQPGRSASRGRHRETAGSPAVALGRCVRAAAGDCHFAAGAGRTVGVGADDVCQRGPSVRAATGCHARPCRRAARPVSA